MEQFMEFFKNLDAFQWVLIGIGVVLLWPVIQERFSAMFVKKEDEKDLSTNCGHCDDDACDYNLTCLVERWERLFDCCHKHELKEACSTLQTVFPMLVKPYSENEPNDELPEA